MILATTDGRQDGVASFADTQYRIDELRHLGALWDEVFPGDRRSDGGTIEKLFAYGDHDVESFTSGSPGLHRGLNRDPKAERAMRRRDIALNDRARQWKEAFHEDFAPVMRKTVKGYDFMLAHLYNDSEIEGLRYADPLYIPERRRLQRTQAPQRARRADARAGGVKS